MNTYFLYLIICCIKQCAIDMLISKINYLVKISNILNIAID